MQILCTLRNEGGVQPSLDILPLLAEEAYLSFNPRERRGRAFLSFCEEGDLEAVVALLAGGQDDEEENEGGEKAEDGSRVIGESIHEADSAIGVSDGRQHGHGVLEDKRALGKNVVGVLLEPGKGGKGGGGGGSGGTGGGTGSRRALGALHGDHNAGEGDDEMDLEDFEDDEDAEMTSSEVLLYQDPMGSGSSALHLAVQNLRVEIVWLLLYLASSLPIGEFPAAVLEAAKRYELERDLSKIAGDIRNLRDSEGRTAVKIAEEVGGLWKGWEGILEA
jgi:hypothetical protein